MEMDSNKSVCIIGAGFSGLCSALQIKKNMPLFSFTIFEMNNDVGGVWLANSYPGCACDIPSHVYSLSFEPYAWSSQYPSQGEILRYMQILATKNQLYSHSKFRHRVESLEWVENRLKWKVTVLEMDANQEHILYFDFVFCGPGEHHLPKIPDIFKEFQGPMMHSAEWKPEIELEGKTVAVIGSGASAVQIIPSIIEKVGKLLSYQRTPAWVIGKLQFSFPPCIRWVFTNVPGIRRLYRTSIYLANEIQYPVFQNQGFLSHIARPIGLMLGKLHIGRQVRNPHLQANLLPNYSFGCNRVCLSTDYFPALTRENVQVIRDDIIEVTQDEIVTKDRRDKIDVLILATGFHTHEYFGPMEIVGRKGENILRKWKVDGPSIYLGIVSHKLPNLFFIHGPGVNVAHNTGLFTIECQVNWILQMINEMERKGASAVSVKKSVEDMYMLRHQRDMKRTIWSGNDCGSYYANSNSLVPIVYPRSQLDYWLRTRRFKIENFEFYSIN